MKNTHSVTLTILAAGISLTALADGPPRAPEPAVAAQAPGAAPGTPTPPRAITIVASATPPAAPVAISEPHMLSEEEAIASYEKALKAAEASQREALEAVEAARRQVELQARETEKARQLRERNRDDVEALRAQAVEFRQANRERERVIEKDLQRAHESLRRASQEVARVHRSINRPTPPAAPAMPGGFEMRFASSERPVIGVVLGGSQGQGVPVLGVSPDGPADRAGIKGGDLVVSMMGKPLAVEGSVPREVLSESLEDIKVGDELAIGVVREGQPLDFTVTVAKREPYSWHGMTRLATAPEVMDGQVIVERIEIPQVDRARLDDELASLRRQMEVVRSDSGATVMHFSDEEGLHEYEFGYQDLSEFGDSVLAGTNVWFGMPLTRGIKMAELDAGLGEYFKVERGVLILKATDDNRLQLKSGDVILKVGGTEVATPGDVVRALRDVASGSQVELDIKRERKNRTLQVAVPENRVGLLLRDDS
jgi:C-terminal processing protease CtpA/Prc